MVLYETAKSCGLELCEYFRNELKDKATFASICGSVASGGYVPGWSDLNLFFIGDATISQWRDIQTKAKRMSVNHNIKIDINWETHKSIENIELLQIKVLCLMEQIHHLDSRYISCGLVTDLVSVPTEYLQVRSANETARIKFNLMRGLIAMSDERKMYKEIQNILRYLMIPNRGHLLPSCELIQYANKALGLRIQMPTIQEIMAAPSKYSTRIKESYYPFLIWLNEVANDQVSAHAE